MSTDQKNGFGIIEILIASTISILLFLSVNSFLSLSLKMAADDTRKAEALSLARSVLEEARAVRDEDQSSPTVDSKFGWNNISGLTFDSAYHFAVSGAGPYSWTPAAGSETIGRYTVWFVVSQVQRTNSGTGDIVALGGTIDPKTIKVTSHVTWASSQGPQEISLYEYLADIK